MRGLDSEKRKKQALGELIPEAEPELHLKDLLHHARKHASKPRLKAEIQAKGNAESQQVPGDLACLGRCRVCPSPDLLKIPPVCGRIFLPSRPTRREAAHPSAGDSPGPPRASSHDFGLTHTHDQGVEGVFQGPEIDELISILEEVKKRAIA